MKLDNVFKKTRLSSARKAYISLGGTRPEVPEGLLRKCNKCGGAIIAEQVFGLPGFGSAILNAINMKDTPIVLGATLFLSFTYMIIMLVLDLVNALLNPKFRDSIEKA